MVKSYLLKEKMGL